MKNYYKSSTTYNGLGTRNTNSRYQKNIQPISNGPRKYQKYTSDEKNYKQSNEDIGHILSKELSKKKNRGILDVSSVGNKDVLTDSDSEAPNKNSKYEDLNRKSGCAKLIIEKVESQVPARNEEYYKFTNKKKIYPYNNKVYNSNNRFIINKKLEGSPIGNKNNSFYKNQMYQSQDYENLTKFRKNQGVNELIIEPYNNNFSNYKKNNYSVNRVLTTDDSSKSNNNFNYNNERRRDSLGNNYIGNIVVPNRNIQLNKSPYMKSSAENSVDKGSISYNYSINQPKNRNFLEESYQGNRTLLNNEENYIKKRTMGLRKNLAPKDIPHKSISFGNYKDLSKRPQLNLNYNPNNSNSFLQNRFNNTLIKNATKIQSFWRGAFTRELMTFFWNLNILRDNLDNVFKNHLRDNFQYFLNNLKSYQKPKKISVTLSSRNPPIRQKFLISKHKTDKSGKFIKIDSNNNSFNVSTQENTNDEKYNKLLENYNSLLDKYNKLKEEKEKDNNIKKNSFDKLDINSINFGLIYKKNKINTIKKDQNKKFEVIEPGLKEEFNIIPKKHKRKKSNKKQIKSIEKVSEIIYEKTINKNNPNSNNITYEDYLNHFKSNIYMINDNQLYIKKTLKKNNKNKLPTIEDIITSKTFKNISVNKNNNNEITILKTKKPELVQESQKNLNTEIKGIENDELNIFKDCVVNEHKNNINIIQVNEQDMPKKDIILNIVSEEKFDIIDNNKANKEKEKKTKKKLKNKNKEKEKVKIDSDKNKNKNKELVIEKKEDILLVERNKIKKFDDMIMIDNNNTLLLKNSKKNKRDEITEITEELNKIEPNNHYELIFEGIIFDLNHKLDNIQKEKENKINDKKIYNENNEIEKGEELEINSMEMTKTKNNGNNIFISKEDKMEVLNSKDDIFAEKAKRNMMKIILPIRLKSTIREYVRKNTYPLLVSNLKKIALRINSSKSDDNEKEKESINKKKATKSKNRNKKK